MTPSRRSFIHALGSLLGAAAVAPGEALRNMGDTLQAAGTTDEEIAGRTFTLAARRGLSREEIGDIIAAIGTSFIGTPYVAHSLEVPGPEHLVVNLHAFDCTTFVESVLALSRCIRLGTPTFPAFQLQLQHLRYRDGQIHGYPSRLHYFIDWIGDNEKKGVVRNITGELGGVEVTKPIDFMTTHTDAYRQLGEKENLDAVALVEHRLSSHPYAVLSRQAIAPTEANLKNGDIIALATAMKGLDVSHVGFALRSGNVVKFLHAPLSGGSVQLSPGSLAEYVADLPKATGIIVARPLNPSPR
jgi:cell wall-associated NlpC family hydrolase